MLTRQPSSSSTRRLRAGCLPLLVWLSAVACGGSESDPAAEAPGSEGASAPTTGAATAAPASPAAAATGSGSAPVGSAPASGAQPPEAMTGSAVPLDPSAPAAATGSAEGSASATDAPAANAGATDASGAGEPAAAAPERPSVDQASLAAVTLHLAGDSTVMKYAADSAQEGWGQELVQLFIDKVSVDNQAIGGASVASFHSSSRWTNITSKLKAGDFVMAAFGANDSGFTADRHVEPAAFKALFSQMADEVEAKDATFILVTPSALQEWRADKEGNARLGPYVDVLNELGQARGLLIDDLNARSIEFLDGIGQEAAKEIYINGDKAHFTKKGATQMAELVAAELPRIGSPLADYLK